MFEIVRQVLPDGGQHKGTSSCQAEKCKRATREGKPFCSGHIEQAPYVASILDILEKRGAEEAILESGKGKVSGDGFFYKETLLLLRTKNFTAKALSRRLDISHKAADRLIRLLVKDKLAVATATQRGDLILSGVGPQDLAVDKD